MCPDFVRPLCTAENHFLQVLLTQFSLSRVNGAGTQLRIHFDDQTPTIWLRQAKFCVRDGIADFSRKAKQYQEDLDAFLVQRTGANYEFNDPEFPFRYGSGGTLPVMRMGDLEYYCLIYRDLPPVGWNIANGGCDSRHELLRPLLTVERELREELVILQPKHGRRYVFEADEGRPLEHPDFAVAWELWQPRFRKLGFPPFNEWQHIPLKWLDGPDAIAVRFGETQAVISGKCFLNINAEDFGIEVDRVAKLNIDEDAMLCDGELIQGQLVNQLVGLFEVRSFNDTLAADAREFTPDCFFYNAELFDGRRVPEKVEQCLSALAPVRSSSERQLYEEADPKYDLCPVTRRIVKSYLLHERRTRGVKPDPTSADCDVFISFGSEDTALARQVYDYLVHSARKRVFFSEESLHQADYGKVIDDALDKAKCLIAVGTNVRHLTKPWVEYEWRSFHQDILSGPKQEAGLLSFVSGCDPRDLPRPLRVREAVQHNPSEPAAALRKLAALIP